MARKKKATAEEPKAGVIEPEAPEPEPKAEEPKAEVIAPEPEVVSFGKCKSCGSELKKLLYDSRAKEPLYLYVCDKVGCPIYQQPQKYEGDLPAGMNITIA